MPAMPFTVKQRQQLLRIEQTHDVDAIGLILETILLDNPGATLLDAELALRDAGAKTYLVAHHLNPGTSTATLAICTSMPDMLAALAVAGMTPAENRAALALCRSAYLAA
jgi:hypothetical protein